jgi:hypothetical protein
VELLMRRGGNQELAEDAASCRRLGLIALVSIGLPICMPIAGVLYPIGLGACAHLYYRMGRFLSAAARSGVRAS